MNGSVENDRIFALDGDDGLFGLGGDDFLDGGNGNDHLASALRSEPGDRGNDTCVGGPEVAPQVLVGGALYANTLDQQADTTGLAFWTRRIESGAATTRGQVIAAFSESLEHQILTLPSIEGGVVFA